MAINRVTTSNEENIMSVHITDTTNQPAASQPIPPASRGYLRPLLWLLLVISATGNVVTSASSLAVASIGFGLLTLSFGAALAVHHHRGRRR
jgi:hypothetical protein